MDSKDSSNYRSYPTKARTSIRCGEIGRLEKETSCWSCQTSISLPVSTVQMWNAWIFHLRAKMATPSGASAPAAPLSTTDYVMAGVKRWALAATVSYWAITDSMSILSAGTFGAQWNLAEISLSCAHPRPPLLPNRQRFQLISRKPGGYCATALRAKLESTRVYLALSQTPAAERAREDAERRSCDDKAWHGCDV